MEERWFALAISAHIKGALDFSKISRYNDKSLMLEGFVLDELQRERKCNFKMAKCLYSITNLVDKSENVFGGWAEGERDDYFKLLFPWQDKEDQRSSMSGNPLLRQILEGYKQ